MPVDRAPTAITVVIAAHDEESVLGTTLDTLLADARPGELDVVVGANGCTDDTVQVARSRPGVRAVVTPRASKVAGLNSADAVVSGFPRVYLDADIAVPLSTVRALCDALTEPGTLVAVPARRVALAGRPWAVRAYYAVQSELPAVREGLVGRGMIALSEQGRARFGPFPDVQADDLFLDSRFEADERAHVDSVATVVEAPRRTADLLRRLERVRRANNALRGASDAATGSSGVRRSAPVAWIGVVRRRPHLAPAAVVYVVLTLVAERRARRDPAATAWGRDESTRAPAAARTAS